jgi:hypothetical protein
MSTPLPLARLLLGGLLSLASCAHETEGAPPAAPPIPPRAAQDLDAEATALQQFGGPRTESYHEPKSERYWTRSSIFVAAPMPRVRAVIVDYASYSQIIPETFQRSKVLRRIGLAADVYLQVDVMKGTATMWVDEHFTAPVADGKGEVIVATMNRGNVDDASGTWRFRPAPGGTVVTIELSVDPTGSVPSKLMKREMERACEEATLGIRRRAEGG